MKKRIFSAILIALLLSFCGCASPPPKEADAEIIYPSDAQLNIAAGRDFYVFARVAATYRDSVTEATIALKDSAGNTVREIRSGEANNFKTDLPALNAFHTEADDWLMPDLLYAADDEASLAYPWNKCYVKEGYAIGVISGGGLQGLTDFTNEDGSAFVPIKEREEYSIDVIFGLKDNTTLTATKTITAATAKQKVLSRFSPEPYLAMVEAYAADNDLYLYKDPFPGYWSPSATIEGQEDNPYFAEIKSLWQAADAAEYNSGEVHFFLYNVAADCATNAVEIYRLQTLGDIDDRLSVLRLSLGEPKLAYTTLTGEEKTEKSEFIPLADGDKLELTRAEERKLITMADNVYDCTAKEVKNVDTDLRDGVLADVGDTITLYGVTPPLQNENADLKAENDINTIGNLVEKIKYVFRKDGKELRTETKDVTLARTLEKGWEEESIYEFAHSFVIDETLIGDVEVTLTAYDSHGNAVDGGKESFTLTVAAGGTFGDVPSDLPDATAVYALEEAGVVYGYENGNFLPAENITEGEALAMVARARGFDGNEEAATVNVPCADWLCPYLAWGLDEELVSVKTFDEDAAISEDDFAALIEKAGGDCGLSGKAAVTRIEACKVVETLLP